MARQMTDPKHCREVEEMEQAHSSATMLGCVLLWTVFCMGVVAGVVML